MNDPQPEMMALMKKISSVRFNQSPWLLWNRYTTPM